MHSPWVIAGEAVIGFSLLYLLWKWVPIAIGRAREEDEDPWKGWKIQ